MKPFWVYIDRCADGTPATRMTWMVGYPSMWGDILDCYTYQRRPITLIF